MNWIVGSLAFIGAVTVVCNACNWLALRWVSCAKWWARRETGR